MRYDSNKKQSHAHAGTQTNKSLCCLEETRDKSLCVCDHMHKVLIKTKKK